MNNVPDMTTPDDGAPASDQQLRDAMVRELIALDAARSPHVVAAFRKVPRHLATPDDDMAAVYQAENAAITKKDADGVAISSVSAARIQAMQIEQAAIRPGMRVLEIGSGGVNAAYLAEIVGPEGLVVTVDIDPDVTARAEKFLADTGYDQQVRVITADGEYGMAEHAPYDRVIVTVQAADIPPTWTEQLVDGGRIVVPLRMRGMTRTVALVRHGDRLVSDSVELCGFVPMQGVGENRVRLVLLHDTEGEEVGLRLDGHPEPHADGLRAALRSPRVEAWSGVTLAGDESSEHLDLWLTTALDNLPLLAATPAARERGLVASASPLGVPTLVDADSFAYRTVRRTDNPDRFELGAIGHGSQGQKVAEHLVEEIRVWDREHRRDRAQIEVYPASTPDGQLPEGRVLDRPHTRVLITWP
ncbi:methyltransferase, FxLD system [Streptomyces sp. SID12501]|uniref:Protein-L-isoaspartate O-methyltransferase n=2 Tax=Streptomyces sp. SID12501 TaxID=2706042 RepID=A0A6B3BTX9_9ACTN|nr:methyltransferase, FxLD system [Streptomyces sp. SID12501]